MPEKTVYLDNNATTRPTPESLQEAFAIFDDNFGNPSSKHQNGMRSRAKIEKARRQVADLINVKASEIIFTSGATESNHQAIRGVAANTVKNRRVVVGSSDHSSALLAARELESEGWRITRIAVDRDGRFNESQLSEACQSSPALVSLCWANNETGVVADIEKIAMLTESHQVPLHIDATQAVGKVKVDLSELPIDMLSFSGHKIHALPGSGALYVRNNFMLKPFFAGSQERKRRGGTENLPGIIALGKACELIENVGSYADRMLELRRALESGLKNIFSDVTINGENSGRLPNTSSVTFNGINGEELFEFLSRRGVMVSRGAACLSGGDEPSHVLMAMGLSATEALSTLRFSLSRLNSRADIEYALETVNEFSKRRL